MHRDQPEGLISLLLMEIQVLGNASGSTGCPSTCSVLILTFTTTSTRSSPKNPGTNQQDNLMLLLIVPIHLLLEGRTRVLPLAPPQHQVLVAPKIPGWCGSSPAILTGQKEPTQYHQPTPVLCNWAQCRAARHTQSCKLFITRCVVMIIAIIINPGDLSSWKGIQATQFGITSTGTDMG